MVLKMNGGISGDFIYTDATGIVAIYTTGVYVYSIAASGYETLPLPQDRLIIGKRVLPLYLSPPFLLFMVPLPLPPQPIPFLLPILHCWVSCRACLVLNLFCALEGSLISPFGGAAYSCFALSCWT